MNILHCKTDIQHSAKRKANLQDISYLFRNPRMPHISFSGANISRVILHELDRMSIDMKHCRGQSYDGASNMSGVINGASSIIRTT